MVNYPVIEPVNTEIVKSLIKSLNDLKGSPINNITVCELERILWSLNDYVTLIEIDHKGRMRTVDIDASVKYMKSMC